MRARTKLIVDLTVDAVGRTAIAAASQLVIAGFIDNVKLQFATGRVKDIAPITQLVTQPSALAVNPELKVNSVAELVALIKANPGKYNFASIGNGSLAHLAMEALAIKAGVKLVHVPYPGSPQATTAIIRGDAQMGCSLPAISVTPHGTAGTVKILAVSTGKRSPYLPNVPTLKESGIDVEADAWNGLIAPGGTPTAIIDKINKDVVAIIKEPAARDNPTPGRHCGLDSRK